MKAIICKTIFTAIVLISGLVSAYANTSDDNSITEDSLGIVVTQNSKYLLPGQELEINVLAACNSKKKITEVKVGGATVPLQKNGMASFKTMGGSLGMHEIPVQVFFKDTWPGKTYMVRYEVGQTNAFISLDKMNVLYIGIDNPTWITASGGDEKMTVSIKGGGGQIQKIGSGKYNIRVSTVTDDCTVYIYVDEKLAGASRFRIRNLPIPSGSIGGNTSGDTIVAKVFMAQAGVGAYLKDFPFDVYYKVTAYNLSIQNDKGEIKTINCQSSYFSPEVKQLIAEHLKPGSIVTIGNILALAPDGRKLKLLPLIYFIK